ncbi:APC family permease [Clostridioides difficile]|uniref:APC family permease n=1 Tax=Clostridioides difficile TaxID=1496 RepID=UPI00098AC2C2|nr:amino acid permease [Clostridioides difficile]EGT4035815.1 amino acid permease [Clostridioides difficile]EGT5087805.1 amino acid permease [Clostridioides difficile]EGT5493281.1 amino acid permease [Clostridioides difficile]MDB3267366.1 amino acid permease [Clostridioides difficile]MDB3428556.1 amino acid permease [Clostridioides difficile]
MSLNKFEIGGITVKKKIGFWDLVFMNISALFGIRWIAKSTASSFGLGLGSIPVWLLFAFIFFVPASLICAELAATYPKDGGLGEWVKQAYGEKWGFMVSWLNWTSKIFWYSSFLTFLAINIAYMLGNPDLSNNKMFILALSLIIFWLLSLVSTRGMAFGKFFTNTGALGSTIPAILLIVMAFMSVVILKKAPSASIYTIQNIIPKIDANSLVSISAIIFALSGAETTANFITEMDNAKKNFPKAILTVAVLIGGIYILGSVAITMILPPDEIAASTGILDALAKVAQDLGIGSWFIRIVAFGITLSVLGALILYIAGPVKMLFGNVREGVFPKQLTVTNKHNIPSNAVIIQAIIVSLLLVGTNLLPSVDNIYNVLVTMTALTALFPYVLFFTSYIRLRKTRPNEERPYSIAKSDSVCINIARMVLVVTVVGILFSTAPVMETLKDNIIYEIEMIGGGLFVIITGLTLWKNYEKKISNNSGR